MATQSKKKKFKAVQQNVKLFRANEPILSVLMWGVNHAVNQVTHVNIPPMLLPDDFKAYSKIKVDNQHFNKDIMPSHYKFKEYCPIVFRNLRERFGVDETAYLNALTLMQPEWDTSQGAHRQHKFLTSFDRRFFLKMLSEEDVSQLLSQLPKYHEYIVESQASTLLSHYLGLYRITVNDQKTYFLVMRHMFSPRMKMKAKYDLKGSTVDREATEKERQQELPTFKDNDWIAERLTLSIGPGSRDRLLAQLQKDFQFLERLGVIGYSLLVGIADPFDPSLPTNDQYDSIDGKERGSVGWAQLPGSVPLEDLQADSSLIASDDEIDIPDDFQIGPLANSMNGGGSGLHGEDLGAQLGQRLTLAQVPSQATSASASQGQGTSSQAQVSQSSPKRRGPSPSFTPVTAGPAPASPTAPQQEASTRDMPAGFSGGLSVSANVSVNASLSTLNTAEQASASGDGANPAPLSQSHPGTLPVGIPHGLNRQESRDAGLTGSSHTTGQTGSPTQKQQPLTYPKSPLLTAPLEEIPVGGAPLHLNLGQTGSLGCVSKRRGPPPKVQVSWPAFRGELDPSYEYYGVKSVSYDPSPTVSVASSNTIAHTQRAPSLAGPALPQGGSPPQTSPMAAQPSSGTLEPGVAALGSASSNSAGSGAGERCIYFLGIIDILSKFDAKSRAGIVYKGIKHGPSADISTTRPDFYARRLLDFVGKCSK